MALRLDGKKLAQELEHRLKTLISEERVRAGRPPGLAVLRVGNDPASGVYVSNKEKACTRIGIASFGIHLPETVSREDLIASFLEFFYFWKKLLPNQYD